MSLAGMVRQGGRQPAQLLTSHRPTDGPDPQNLRSLTKTRSTVRERLSPPSFLREKGCREERVDLGSKAQEHTGALTSAQQIPCSRNLTAHAGGRPCLPTGLPNTGRRDSPLKLQFRGQATGQSHRAPLGRAGIGVASGATQASREGQPAVTAGHQRGLGGARTTHPGSQIRRPEPRAHSRDAAESDPEAARPPLRGYRHRRGHLLRRTVRHRTSPGERRRRWWTREPCAGGALSPREPGTAGPPWTLRVVPSQGGHRVLCQAQKADVLSKLGPECCV